MQPAQPAQRQRDLPGRSHAFENGDFRGIGAAGTLASYQLVKIGNDVFRGDKPFSHGY